MPVLDRAKTGGSARSPQPAPPTRQFSFTDFQTNNPSAPLPADRIDGEIDRTNNALADTLDWVSVSLNSDGSLKPQSVGKAQLQPGLFDQIAAPALDEIQTLVNSARAASREAIAAGQEADAASLAAATQNAQAFDAAQLSSTDAQDAAASAAAAAASANAAAASAANALNSSNHADGSEAAAYDYAVLAQAWAEHMPDTIPPNILAVMDITGDHWSSRWWANKALTIVQLAVDGGLPQSPPIEPPGSAALPAGSHGDVNIRNVTNAPITITLPPAPQPGQALKFKDAAGNAGAYPITIIAGGALTIDGYPAYTLVSDYMSIELYWMGSQWGTR